jgi:hypothetical protein
MKKLKIFLPAVFLTAVLMGQQTDKFSIPYKMEDLTSPKFAKAVDLAGGRLLFTLQKKNMPWFFPHILPDRFLKHGISRELLLTVMS